MAGREWQKLRGLGLWGRFRCAEGAWKWMVWGSGSMDGLRKARTVGVGWSFDSGTGCATVRAFSETGGFLADLLSTLEAAIAADLVPRDSGFEGA